MVAIAFVTLERQPMELRLLREGDWLGIITMAIGFGALQTVLEEGNKDDWFGSPFIVRLTALSAVSLIAFVAIELSVKRPAVDLRMLRQRNFALGTIINMVLGFGLYGSVYLLPQYLGQVQGYNSEQIGAVIAWTGLPQLLLIPFVPLLMRSIDARLILTVGLGLFGVSCLMNGSMSVNYSGDQFWLPNIVRAVGQALVLTPLTSIAMVGVTREESAAASGLFNMLRNLGGAFGTALLATIVTKREQFHSNIIGIPVNLFHAAVNDRIARMAEYFTSRGVTDPGEARHQAIIAIGKLIKREALIMGYSDAFIIMGAVMLTAVLLLLFVRKGTGASAMGH
jgi:DHA2 family multidrug resistance protein